LNQIFYSSGKKWIICYLLYRRWKRIFHLWKNQVFRYLKMCEKLLFNKYFLYCQVGVGEDGGIHQSTLSVLIGIVYLFWNFDVCNFFAKNLCIRFAKFLKSPLFVRSLQEFEIYLISTTGHFFNKFKNLPCLSSDLLPSDKPFISQSMDESSESNEHIFIFGFRYYCLCRFCISRI
jgi:hypothetical protein